MSRGRSSGGIGPDGIPVEAMGDDELEAQLRAVQDRRTARGPDRELERFVPPEPHEKYEVDAALIPPGMVAEWKALTVLGMPNNARMTSYIRAGWAPARADQFPQLSGYGIQFHEAVLAAGHFKNVEAGDPVILDGQMLMLRPKQLVDAAHQRRIESARNQFDQQIARLAGRSRAEVGSQNTFHRTTRETIPENI